MVAAAWQPSQTRRRAGLAACLVTALLVAALALRVAGHERQALGQLGAGFGQRPLPPPLPGIAAWAAPGAWRWPLPTNLLDRGVVSHGDPQALQRLASKLLAGKAITVGEPAGGCGAQLLLHPQGFLLLVLYMSLQLAAASAHLFSVPSMHSACSAPPPSAPLPQSCWVAA